MPLIALSEAMQAVGLRYSKATAAIKSGKLEPVLVVANAWPKYWIWEEDVSRLRQLVTTKKIYIRPRYQTPGDKKRSAAMKAWYANQQKA